MPRQPSMLEHSTPLLRSPSSLMPRQPSMLENSTPLLDLAAGFVAGSVSRTLTAPAERVKTELQLATSRQGVQAVCRRVLAESGPKGFFAGNLTNCLKVAPQSALFFALTDYFKQVLPTRGDPQRAEVHSFLAGTMAGVISQMLVYPLEPVKTCLTVAPEGRFRGIIDCARQMYWEAGWRGLYRGALPTLAGCVPYAGTQRLVYDAMQRAHSRSRYSSPSAAASFSFGLVSSTAGMAVSYPFMVVRTRLQVQGTDWAPEGRQGGHKAAPLRYANAWDCVRKTFAREGLRGLFKGLVPNSLKAAPAAAVNFALYDLAKDRFDSLRSSSHASAGSRPMSDPGRVRRSPVPQSQQQRW